MIWIFNRNKINKIKEKHEDELLKKANCVGVGIGKKITKGKQTKKDAILVFVTNKKSIIELAPNDIIPKKLDGALCDVVEAGEIWAANVFRSKHRPLIGGVSACNFKGSACTSGIRVWRDEIPYTLMNYHCVIGTNWGGKVGDIITNPSRKDGGSEDCVIGRATSFSSFDEGVCDAALVDLTTEMEDKVPVIGEYHKEVKKVKIGDVLEKSGRTTSHTKGTVIAVNATISVSFNKEDGSLKTLVFRNQILTDNKGFIMGGDSSSIAFLDKYPVAQIFAASPSVGVMTPLQVVLDKLGASLTKQNIKYVAVGHWLDIRGLSVTTRKRTRLRKYAGISNNNVIRVLPRNTKLIIKGVGEIEDGFLWIEVGEDYW